MWPPNETTPPPPPPPHHPHRMSRFLQQAANCVHQFWNQLLFLPAAALSMGRQEEEQNRSSTWSCHSDAWMWPVSNKSKSYSKFWRVPHSSRNPRTHFSLVHPIWCLGLRPGGQPGPHACLSLNNFILKIQKVCERVGGVGGREVAKRQLNNQLSAEIVRFQVSVVLTPCLSSNSRRVARAWRSGV